MRVMSAKLLLSMLKEHLYFVAVHLKSGYGQVLSSAETGLQQHKQSF